MDETRGSTNGRTTTESRHDDVRIESSGVRVTERRSDVGYAEARNRFGGIDVPATFVGMLAAIALTVLLGGILGAAVGAYGYQAGVEGAQEEITIAGLIAGFVTLAVAFFVGGWTAGRIARYDGARNGAVVVGWTLLLAAVLAGLGAWLGAEYNVFENVGLPQWFSSDALTIGAIASGVGALIVMLIAAVLGGIRGEKYHQRVDSVIAATRDGGLAGSTVASRGAVSGASSTTTAKR